MSIIKPRGRFVGDEIVDQERKHLEPEELVRLFKALEPDPFWYAYFRTQYYYGCRVSEVALILKEDVSFARKMIVIRRLKKRVKEGKKSTQGGYKEHTYDVPDVLLGLFKSVLKLVPKESGWLFGSQKRPEQCAASAATRMTQIRRLDDGWRAVSRAAADTHFRKAAKAAGIPRRLAHTHVLRHTRATLLLAEGAHEEDVKLLLGHSSVGVTRRYLGVAQSMRAKAKLVLGDLA